MKNPEVATALRELTDPQRTAATWDSGAMLVLAGPGSGKTRVLTTRIANLLTESDGRNFRILALTFTNKAAAEMASRVAALTPKLEQRTFIGTFHSFCMQMLQQHGVHLGINPDFAIYSQEADRRDVLSDGLRREGVKVTDLDRYLPLIDKLKSRLIPPSEAAKQFRDPESGKHFADVYRAYEVGLAAANALDFSSLIERAYALISQFPGVAVTYRRIYTYWMIDEYQDTNDGQYRFLKALAGDSFRNIFAVADDDQIIYQWNGASYFQIQRFRSDFKPEQIQLPTNYRCPAAIVGAANRLVVHNTQRTDNKLPLEVGKTKVAYPEEDHIRLLQFDTDTEEANGVAEDIGALDAAARGQTVVLARTRKQIETMKQTLTERGIPSLFSQRRDEFASSPFQWLHAVLRQAVRPMDTRNFEVLVSSFNRMVGTTLRSDVIVAEANESRRSFIAEWSEGVKRDCDVPDAVKLGTAAVALASDVGRYRIHIKSIIDLFPKPEEVEDVASDYSEDHSAWFDLVRVITKQIGSTATLEKFLQELSLWSKEPPGAADAVSLMTIHGAKGKEFDHVYLIGLAESVLPSFQSIKAGEQSAEMEEERRNCFVAVTRTKETLTLSWAKSYRGWLKEPSRFLFEMELLEKD